jgi:hypothetical protein
VIPTMLVIGLLVGRWAAVPLGGVAWAIVLLASGTIGWSGVAVAVLVAAANVAAGVAVRRAVAPARLARRRGALPLLPGD